MYCRLQGRACQAKPLFGLTIYLSGRSGYPTLGCSRLRGPMRSLSSLSQCFLILRSSLSLSLSLFPPPKISSTSLSSFLLFIALVNGVIIIIFSLSAKRGPMSINLSGFLGTSGFGNGSYCSKCVRQRSFLRFCQALKQRCDRSYVQSPEMASQAACQWGVCSLLFKYSGNTQFRLVIIVGLGRGFCRWEVWTSGPNH